MRRILRRLVNTLAYMAAGLVILLAIMVGLFRLFLPRLPEYQEDIKSWANAAIGMQVEFSDMNARWRLTGPELNFYGAQLTLPDTEESLIEAAEVTVGVGLLRLLLDRTLVVDRILVRETEISVERVNGNRMLVQGLPLGELSSLMPLSNPEGDVVFVGQDLAVRYVESGSEEVLSFDIALVEVSRHNQLLTVDASIDLHEGFGSRLDVTVDQRALPDTADTAWDFFVEGRALGLARWAYLLPEGVAPVTNGTSDLSLWLQWSNGAVSRATANFLIEDFSVEKADRGAPLEVEGRLEFLKAGGGFLLNAENFRLRTVDGDWPRSSFQIQIGRDSDRVLRSVNAQSSYLKISDLSYVSSWLPADVYDLFAKYRPLGEVRDLTFNLAGWQTEAVSFDVSAELEETGIRAVGAVPGVSQFYGQCQGERQWRSFGSEFGQFALTNSAICQRNHCFR